jgi:hypothetical protein
MPSLHSSSVIKMQIEFKEVYMERYSETVPEMRVEETHFEIKDKSNTRPSDT